MVTEQHMNPFVKNSEHPERIERSIAVYGAYNEQRLTGKHETQSIDKFSFGVSDRGASIRIPIATVESGWNGWLEDRRPSSNCDPYVSTAFIIDTVKAKVEVRETVLA